MRKLQNEIIYNKVINGSKFISFYDVSVYIRGFLYLPLLLTPKNKNLKTIRALSRIKKSGMLVRRQGTPRWVDDPMRGQPGRTEME